MGCIKKYAIKISCLLTLVVLVMACQEVKKEQSPLPNVVFVLADDIGYGDLGSYGGKIPTPKLDALAAGGMRFTDAHSSAALCAPSRFSMLTGSYPYRSYSAGGAWNTNSPSIFTDPYKHNKAGHKVTVAEVMQKAGYRTAFFGKSHLGGDVRNKEGQLIRKQNKLSEMDFTYGVHNSINEYGFDYSYALPSGIQHEPFAFFENGEFAPFDENMPADNSSTKMWFNGRYEMDNGISEIVEHRNNPGIGDVAYNSSQTGIMMIDKAMQFIDKHLKANKDKKENKPFLIYFASQAIHVPHTPPNDFDGDDSEMNEPINGVSGGATGDFIYELDTQVGKLLEKLDSEGLTDNTIVFFTSDNGALWPRICDFGNESHDNNGPLRDYKASVYEGGHRVPFIVSWPGVINPGSVSHEAVLAHDWVATMYELTNQSMEDDQAMDCSSLLPLLKGDYNSTTPLHPFIIYQAGFAYDGAIRQDDWVLLVDRSNQATELYNLKNDLAQETNLIDKTEHQELIKQLLSTFLQHNDHKDDTLEPRTTLPFKMNS